MNPSITAGKRTAALVLALAAALAIPAIAPAGKAQNGLYKGKATNVKTKVDRVKVKFRVAKGGKRIKKWTAEFLAVCPGFIPVAQLVKQPMPTMKVNRKGRFGKQIERGSGTEKVRIEVRGKLKGKKVRKGIFSYQVGFCSRGKVEPIRWKAKRVRR